MELRRFWGYFRATVVVGGMVVISVFSTLKIFEMSADAFRILFQNFVLAAISSYLLFFLVLLMVRYGALLLYSYMEHVANFMRKAAEPQRDFQEEASLPMITLVVPAYNEGPVIQSAIRSLLRIDYPNYEIIVVDDGSTDDTYDKAMAITQEPHSVPLRVITKSNGGKADALNTGMASARGEFILNMDGDSKLSRNALRACIIHFADPRIGAVAGNVKVFNRENIWTRVQALEYVEGLAMARKAQSFMRSVIIIPGPLGMFRKSVLQQIGGYDHDTFAEDCDLTLKILMRGWHVAYEPSAIAWVESPSRLLDLLKQRYRWTRGILQATRKHRLALWRPGSAGINFYILWYMLFESVVWPFSNVLGNIFFIYVGLEYGVSIFLFYWWLQLTMLDVISATYCVIVEDEDPSLVSYSIVFRLFYIVIIDILKVFATIDEFRGVAMTWGKLMREGKI